MDSYSNQKSFKNNGMQKTRKEKSFKYRSNNIFPDNVFATTVVTVYWAPAFAGVNCGRGPENEAAALDPCLRRGDSSRVKSM